MASTSSSSIEKSFKYDVFLSFRGEDTRNSFVGHLYQALKQKGIETYKDDEKIEQGERINDQLMRSIQDSRFFIIVFSKTYASSSWCLDELVKIMECRKTRQTAVYPIFYDVEPTEVRKQKGLVGKAFSIHENKEAAGKWREAMKEASDLAGWELKKIFSGDESKLIQIIVDIIFRRLCSINLSDDGKLVGMETRINKILSSLEMDNQDVRIIGIKGMGGGGKTTLAEAVCDQISLHFEGISFVENVRVVSKESPSGLKMLQKQILADVLKKQDIIVSSVRDGKRMMGNMMCGTKVLIVLDDVDHKSQLEALAGDLNWFKSGSRIIITTRDEQVLLSHGVSLICNVNLLTDDEAVCLFNRYAFGKKIPSQGYNEMSGQVVRYAAGLPLTVKVLGSFLCGKKDIEWKNALERLRKIPEHETQEILKISYDALEKDYKEIFLDVACILKGEQKDKAIRVLESCGFSAIIGLRVLEEKSLLSVSKYGSLAMHDRIEEMGKYIDCHLHPDEHNRHSRLWIEKEIKDILANNMINEAIRCIKLSPQRHDLRTFMKGFRNMKKLRVLYMCSGSYWDDSDVSQIFPSSLKYLCWRAYPFSSLHETFQADNLAGLDMSFSPILQLLLVEKGKALTKLRFLDLSNTGLGRLNLGLTPNLESLDLKDCRNLVEINAPVGCLKNLLYMDLSGCGITEVPKDLHHLLHLEELYLSKTKIKYLPDSICMLKQLKFINLEDCHNLEKLPDDFGQLDSLEELILSNSKIKHLPDSVCMLKQLKYLKLQGCGHLEKLPEGFGQLECLKELNITGTAISHLPQCIFGLKGVRIIGSKMMLESFGFTFEIQSSDHETFVNITGAPKQESPVLSMASSSSTLSTRNSIKYDVFLSFRGKDTRINFVGNLYHALKKKGIKTYMDDDKIKEGKTITDQLIKSIGYSRFYIIVFSKNYASSSWCLEELAKIMECQKVKEHTAYPVFYDVEPTEVSRLSGAVGEAFSKHENQEAAGKWRDAMEELADLAGWELKATSNRDESKLIQIIVDVISKEKYSTLSNADEKLVGMETRISDVLSSLEISTQDVRMIGIKGIGGGGKTTLARAVYDQISYHFEGKCFVENVREVSKPSFSGLMKLQKKIINDVFYKKDIAFSSVYEGKNMLKDMMSRRKTLIVLDDVDRIEQLEALAGEPDWFKAGSRIIITTRDEQVLLAHRVSLIRNVTLLSQAEAGCLFSRYAFGREIPTQRYEELSGKVVQYAHGLPLTIKVLGSFLCGQSEPYWVDAIERLKKIPYEATMKRLEISFDGLEDDYKEIFLDIACILKGWVKDDAIRVLESRGFHAEVGLRVLEQKSLITCNEDEELWMHDHLEEMGRKIVRRSYPDEPQRHSRLWVNEEIEYILTNDLGTQATKCLRFLSWDFSAEIAVKGLAKMKDLRFVFMNLSKDYFKGNIVEFYKVSEYLPSSLRYMNWIGFPFLSLPKTFQGKYLVELDIRYGKIVQLWEDGEGKVLHKLRFLQIMYSKLRTFDLRLAPNLEQLTIYKCDDFVELEMPSECLKLEKLYLGHLKLRTLDLGLTPNLKSLNLENCSDLVEINAPIGCLRNLDFLDLSCCGKFKSFVFDKWYHGDQAGSLSELHLIAEPTDVCPLHSDNDSPKFRFSCYYKEDKASSFGNLERLISIGLCACTNLESFSRSICSLQCIRKLTLKGSISEAPRDLDQLECLEELTFSSTVIKHLPDSICKLKHLKSLELKSCFLLEKLPDDLGQIESLETLTITDCNRLRDIPNNMGKIKCVISSKVYKRYTHGRYKQRPINDAVDRPTVANT